MLLLLFVVFLVVTNFDVFVELWLASFGFTLLFTSIMVRVGSTERKKLYCLATVLLQFFFST